MADDEHAEDIAQLVRQLSEARAQRDRFRAILVALVGVETREELEMMEMFLRQTAAPAEDTAASIDAIHALLATMP